jgi:hypothetical protein
MPPCERRRPLSATGVAPTRRRHGTRFALIPPRNAKAGPARGLRPGSDEKTLPENCMTPGYPPSLGWPTQPQRFMRRRLKFVPRQIGQQGWLAWLPPWAQPSGQPEHPSRTGVRPRPRRPLLLGTGLPSGAALESKQHLGDLKLRAGVAHLLRET